MSHYFPSPNTYFTSLPAPPGYSVEPEREWEWAWECRTPRGAGGGTDDPGRHPTEFYLGISSTLTALGGGNSGGAQFPWLSPDTGLRLWGRLHSGWPTLLLLAQRKGGCPPCLVIIRIPISNARKLPGHRVGERPGALRAVRRGPRQPRKAAPRDRGGGGGGCGSLRSLQGSPCAPSEMPILLHSEDKVFGFPLLADF